LGIISRRCSANPPYEAIPGTVREMCGKAGVNSVTLCRPLLYGLYVAPLERGRRNPRKRYGRQPCTRAGRRCDVRPVEHASSVTSGPVRASPLLCYHPGHCSTIPDAVGARDDKTPPHLPLCILRPSVSCTLESVYGRRPKREAPTQPPSKPLLGGYRTRHDARRKQDSSGRPSTPQHHAPCRHM
jgi:hypothetical protein